MFHESSRYYKAPTVKAKTDDGSEVDIVKFRRLPKASGETTVVQGNSRLDVMAHQHYGDGTRFWRIGDANTELKATDLVSEVGRIIEVPE
ncbi:MAG: hypothetical protein KJ630_04175 [Proteobacteria bacterium]|nr:hypothetical protein [Pseudomonadota bacterium]